MLGFSVLGFSRHQFSVLDNNASLVTLNYIMLRPVGDMAAPNGHMCAQEQAMNTYYYSQLWPLQLNRAHVLSKQQ
jgi:hypothetical protein